MSIASERLRYQTLVGRKRFRMFIQREVTAVLEANERGRPYRAVFYGLLATGGIILMTDPTRQLEHAGSVRWVWSAFMVTGTLTSLLGVLRDRWRMEWYGLPLQTSSFAGLVFVLLNGGPGTGRLAFACFTAAPIAVLVHRFVVLYRLAKATKKMVNSDRGGE